MSGTRLMVHVLGRAQRRRLLVWTFALVGSLGFTAVSIARLYDTPAKVHSYSQAVVSDALVAINGRVEGIASLGGIVQDEFGFMASFLMPLVGIALVASTTRVEEESGRMEALLSGRVDRRAPVVAALTLVLGAAALMTLGFVVVLVVSGIQTSSALLYALSLSMVTLVFAGLAAVCAQVVLHGRGVYALCFVAVGLAYVLRGIGDVTHTFWVWLSPLGWLEKAAPFAHDPRWWVLVIPLAAALALSVLAVALARRRDLGASVYRQGPGPEGASSWLVRPLGLAVHGQQGAFLAWMIGSLALAAVMGALAQELINAVTGNPSLGTAVDISSQDPADSFMAFTQVYLALIACGYVVQAFATLRREETSGRLEPMLAGRVGRIRWLGAQLTAVLGGLVLIVCASALLFGAAAALSMGGSGYLGIALQAGLEYLPAELVVAGVALLLYGVAPRAFALAWFVFGAITFIGLLGTGLRMPQWVLHLSPLTSVGNPPQSAIDLTALTWLSAIAVVLTAAAFATFRRRLIPQG